MAFRFIGPHVAGDELGRRVSAVSQTSVGYEDGVVKATIDVEMAVAGSFPLITLHRSTLSIDGRTAQTADAEVILAMVEGLCALDAAVRVVE